MSREAIYAALGNLVSGVPGIVTFSRKLRHWADVSPSEQPALFLVQKGETMKRTFGLPPRREGGADLVLYVNTASDPDASPASVLNPILDAIEAALAPLPSAQEQTLGGLVAWARIEGHIETDEGALGSQAVAIIPLEILFP